MGGQFSSLIGPKLAYYIGAMETKTRTDIPLYHLTIPVTQEFIDSLLTCAFEGGINYWAECNGVTSRNGQEVKLDKSDLKAHCWYADLQQNWQYEFIDREETGKPFVVGQEFRFVGPFRDELGQAVQGSGKYRHLNAITLQEGLQLWATAMWGKNGDGEGIPALGEIDAPMVDSIIQCAVFGGLVFG